MTPRALIFDLDGTLVDSVPGIARAVREAIAPHLPDTPLPDLTPFVGPPIREVMARALAIDDAALLDALVVRFRNRYDTECWQDTAPYPGVVDGLAGLAARGVTCFVATNKPAFPTQRILEATGLLPLIREAVSPDSARPAHATKAVAVRDLLLRHGLDPGATWLVGDSADDREAAEANGVHFVPVAYGYGSPGPGGLDRFPDLLDHPAFR